MYQYVFSLFDLCFVFVVVCVKIDAALAEIKKLGIDEINAELLQDQQQLKKVSG